jgi:hypothetical protein
MKVIIMNTLYLTSQIIDLGLHGRHLIPDDFYLRFHLQIEAGTHPLFYPVGTTDSFPGGKATGVWS